MSEMPIYLRTGARHAAADRRNIKAALAAHPTARVVDLGPDDAIVTDDPACPLCEYGKAQDYDPDAGAIEPCKVCQSDRVIHYNHAEFCRLPHNECPVCAAEVARAEEMFQAPEAREGRGAKGSREQ